MDLQKTMNDLREKSEMKVKFVAENDKTTCEACKKNDGKIFNINDADLPLLPIHPHCRCKFVKVGNENTDVSREVAQYCIINHFVKRYQISEAEAEEFARQILAARAENKKIREQKIFLLFNGRYLMSSDGMLLLDAVSGKPVSENTSIDRVTVSGLVAETIERKFDYSYSRQGKENIGGIPRGLYYIKAEEERSALTSPYSHIIKRIGWGRYAWALHPDEDTDVRDRDNFFIHGGSDFGTGGCIDLQENDAVFRQYFKSTGLSSAYVYVRYEQNSVKIKEKKSGIYPFFSIGY